MKRIKRFLQRLLGEQCISSHCILHTPHTLHQDRHGCTWPVYPPADGNWGNP